MTIEIKCPNCSSTVVADEAVSEVFCTYCGTKFPVRRTLTGDQIEQTIAYVRNAYAVREFAEAMRGAAEQTDEPLLRIYAAAAAVRHAYAEYVEQAQELYGKKSGRSGLIRLFTGKDGYGDNELHSAFYVVVQEKCAALAEALRTADINSECASVCADTVRDMLRYKSAEQDIATYWSECALEYQAVQFLPFLETETLTQIYNAYIGCRKSHELLPNQAKTEKAMQDELASRGVNARGRGGLGEKMRNLFGRKSDGKQAE